MNQIKKKKILIVDDDPICLEHVKMLIEQVFDNVLTFTLSNGKAGLEVAKLLNPDLIITDCDMPVLNGLEMTASFRTHNKHTPVVMLSGSDCAKETFLTLAGGTMFHAKPATAHFIREIGQLLKAS